MQEDGAWSSLNLMGQAFLSPHGSPYPLEEWMGGELGEGGEGEEVWEEGWEEELWLECKMKFLKIHLKMYLVAFPLNFSLC